ncbi:HAD hydrolase family protein, partial [Pseudomonas aeruginosa]
ELRRGEGFGLDVGDQFLAGVGVAMDNAIPSVKEVANFVTKSNLEDGVAFAIEKYVLN